MNTQLHAVTDAEGRPIRFCMTVGHVSDDTGAAAVLGSLPAAEWLIADRGDDADWFRDALKATRIKPFHRLCCTNSMRDSSCESSVVAERYERTHTPRLQDPELA